jgi:hypothetical protein
MPKNANTKITYIFRLFVISSSALNFVTLALTDSCIVGAVTDTLASCAV